MARRRGFIGGATSVRRARDGRAWPRRPTALRIAAGDASRPMPSPDADLQSSSSAGAAVGGRRPAEAAPTSRCIKTKHFGPAHSFISAGLQRSRHPHHEIASGKFQRRNSRCCPTPEESNFGQIIACFGAPLADSPHSVFLSILRLVPPGRTTTYWLAIHNHRSLAAAARGPGAWPRAHNLKSQQVSSSAARTHRLQGGGSTARKLGAKHPAAAPAIVVP